MNTITEEIFEAIKALPERQAAEVLSYAQALRRNREDEYERAKRQALAMLDNPPRMTAATQKIDWALFRQHRGAYDGSKIDREALYDRGLR